MTDGFDLQKVLASIDRSRNSLDEQGDEAYAMYDRGEIEKETLEYVDSVTAFQRALVDIQAAMPTWIDKWGDKATPVDPHLVDKARRLHDVIVDVARLMDIMQK